MPCDRVEWKPFPALRVATRRTQKSRLSTSEAVVAIMSGRMFRIPPKLVSRSLVALLLLTAFVWLWQHPGTVANLLPFDATEYAVSAQNLALFGKFQIIINGEAHPPRYPPWFPLLLLAPVYVVVRDNLAAGIFGVLGCALASVWLTYRLGKEIGGETGGILSALLLLFGNASFRENSGIIMSDLPAQTAGLAAAWVFLKLQSAERTQHLWFASLLCGIAFGFRMLYAALVLPFLYLWVRRKPRRVTTILILLAGTTFFFTASAVYNQLTFGDWKRTGYHYWCAVPYDYFSLTFSPNYLSEGVRPFLTPGGLVVLASGLVGMVLLRKDPPHAAPPLMLFTLLGVLPITIMHLFYFFRAGLRFHLLLVALLVILGGGALGRMLEKRMPKLVRFEVVALVLIVILVGGIPRVLETPPLGRRAFATALDETLPRNAVLISDLNGVFMEPHFLRGTHREILPLTREAEYASKIIVYRRVPDLEPRPASPFEHRHPALLTWGKEAMPYTASDLDQVAQKMAEGKPVFLDIVSADASSPVVVALATRFQLQRQQNGLVARVLPRN
jgi:hypothetical protein